MKPLVLLAWVGVVISLIYLWRRLGSADTAALAVWINSDTLWQANVFTDVITDHYPFSGWVFSIAPSWFPDLLTTGTFWLITKNVIIATLMAGFIQIGLLIGALHLCGNAAGVRFPGLADTLLLATGVIVTLYVAAHPGCTYPDFGRFFIPQSHVGNLIAVLFGLGLGLRLIKKRRASQPVSFWLFGLYALLCFLSAMSNILFITHFLVPLTLSVGFAVSSDVLTWNESAPAVAAGWVAALLGAMFNRTVFNATPVGAEAGISLDRILVSSVVFLRGAGSKLLAGDLLHVLAFVWLFVCLSCAAYTLRLARVGASQGRSSSQTLAYLLFSSLFLAGICSVLSIVLGGSNGLAETHDYVWSMHYLHPLFLLPVLGLVFALAWGISLVCTTRLQLMLAAIAALFSVAAPLYAITTHPTPRESIAHYQPPLVRCIDNIADRQPLVYGYAGYWQARLITLLSRRGVRAYAVDTALHPLLWVNNREWYSHALENRSKSPGIDFVVLDDPARKIPREMVVRAHGEPSHELTCGNTTVLIYASGILGTQRPSQRSPQ